MGVKLQPVDFAPIYRAIITSLTTGAGNMTKDMLDCYFESLSTYASLGIIEEGLHYSIVARKSPIPRELNPGETDPGLIYLHPRGCYEKYLEERRRTGQDGYAMGNARAVGISCTSLAIAC